MQNQLPEQEQPKSKQSGLEVFKAILPATVAAVASLSIIGVGIFLCASGNVSLGLPVLSTVAGILMPSPFANSTSTKN